MSASIKNNLLTKYIKLEYLTVKNKAQTKYKKYRNLLFTLLRESKRFHLSKYLQNNLNDLKSTWKGIETLIYLKQSPNIALSTIIGNFQSLTKQ